MIPYVQTMSMFNKDGIIFNDGNDYDYINKYLQMHCRGLLPYGNIPNHIKRAGLFRRINVSNQIMNFDEHYITISDGRAIDRFAVYDAGEALMMTKILPNDIYDNTAFNTRNEIMTRKELDQIFTPADENETVYVVTTQGAVHAGRNITYLEEEEMLNNQKERFLNQLKRANETHFTDDTFRFLERKINEMTVSDLKDYPLPPVSYIVKMNGTDIKVQLIYTTLISSNHYNVLIKDLPLSKYILEQLKYTYPNIVELKEPKISLRLNQGISSSDVKYAKQMVLEKRNRG